MKSVPVEIQSVETGRYQLNIDKKKLKTTEVNPVSRSFQYKQ